MTRYLHLGWSSVFTLFLLAGCGGGSGTDTTSTTTYPLEQAYKAQLLAGLTVNYKLTGTCTGTATRNEPKPVDDTFENTSVYSVTSTTTIDAPTCTALPVTGTAVRYNDLNLNPLGYTNPGLEYTEYNPSPVSIPATVRVGDTGVLAYSILYTDSAKTQATGASEYKYVIEKDTATTAIVNFMIRRYDGSAVLTTVTQDRYRIDEKGTLTPMTLEIHDGANFFLYTPK